MHNVLMKAREGTPFCLCEATACFLICFAWLGRCSLYFIVVTGLPQCSKLYIRRQAEKHAVCQWVLAPMPASDLKQCIRVEALTSMLHPREIPAQPAGIYALAGLSSSSRSRKTYIKKIRLRFFLFAVNQWLKMTFFFLLLLNHKSYKQNTHRMARSRS